MWPAPAGAWEWSWAGSSGGLRRKAKIFQAGGSKPTLSLEPGEHRGSPQRCSGCKLEPCLWKAGGQTLPGDAVVNAEAPPCSHSPVNLDPPRSVTRAALSQTEQNPPRQETMDGAEGCLILRAAGQAWSGGRDQMPNPYLVHGAVCSQLFLHLLHSIAMPRLSMTSL